MLAASVVRHCTLHIGMPPVRMLATRDAQDLDDAIRAVVTPSPLPPPSNASHRCQVTHQHNIPSPPSISRRCCAHVTPPPLCRGLRRPTQCVPPTP